MSRIILIVLLFGFTFNGVVFAQAVPNFPKWDLSKNADFLKEDGSYEQTDVYVLRPPDTRDPVSITESIAKQVLSGSMTPEVAYQNATGAARLQAAREEDENVYHSRKQIEEAVAVEEVTNFHDPEILAGADSSGASGVSNSLGSQASSGLQASGSLKAGAGLGGLQPSGAVTGGMAPAGGLANNSSQKILDGIAAAKGVKSSSIASKNSVSQGNSPSKDSADAYGQRKLSGVDSAFMQGVSKNLNTSFDAGVAGIAAKAGGYFKKPEEVKNQVE